MQFATAKDRIIVALDFSAVDPVREAVKALRERVGYGKVGLELATGIGTPAAIDIVRKAGLPVFYDGKFNDIPNTVGAATKNAVAHGAKIVNVHASAGKESMKAVVDNKRDALVLAVTVLTSINSSESCTIFGMTALSAVQSFAVRAAEAGVDGIICSPQEVAELRRVSKLRNILMVTPGVRPTWYRTQDQKRVMTPREAILAGADMLVVGRPITEPPSDIGTMAQAADAIAEEINAALKERE